MTESVECRGRLSASSAASLADGGPCDHGGPDSRAGVETPAARARLGDCAVASALGAITFALDFATKAWATRRLGRLFESLAPSPWLTLRVSKNHGDVWGLLPMMSGQVARILLPFLGSIVLAYVISAHRGLRGTKRARDLAFALVLGGACGNLFDRLRLGYVVDFIDLHVGRRGLQINLADVAIAIGVVLLGAQVCGNGASRTGDGAARP